MPFWKKDTPEDLARKALEAQQEADQQESLLMLRQGNLPLAASRRLTKQASMGGQFFTTNLSPAEYLLARQVNMTPLGQVMGTTFMRAHYFEGSESYSSVSGELIFQTDAKSNAQALAIERLRQEAKLLGAHGVIGVKLTTTEFAWSQHFAEFTAVGTAIRMPDSATLITAKNLPFTSTLSGQEFWQLYESGYWPCGLAIGNSLYLAASPWSNLQTTAALAAQSVAGNYNGNVEMHTFSDGIRNAKRAAMQRLAHEVEILGGDGAVDMDVDYKLQCVNHTSQSTLIDFTAVGTAVKHRTGIENKLLGKRLFIMDLAQATNEKINAPTAVDH